MGIKLNDCLLDIKFTYVNVDGKTIEFAMKERVPHESRARERLERTLLAVREFENESP
jgi:hypothetical protein